MNISTTTLRRFKTTSLSQRGKKTNGLFGAIVSLATAFPVHDPETGHATGAWKVACESIDLDEVPLSDIADMISCFGSKTITDFRLYNREVDITPWQQALGELLLRGRVQKDDYPWIQCPNSDSALNMMNMVMGANLPKDFFDDCTLGDEEYGCGEEAHEMASDGRKSTPRRRPRMNRKLTRTRR